MYITTSDIYFLNIIYYAFFLLEKKLHHWNPVDLALPRSQYSNRGIGVRCSSLRCERWGRCCGARRVWRSRSRTGNLGNRTHKYRLCGIRQCPRIRWKHLSRFRYQWTKWGVGLSTQKTNVNASQRLLLVACFDYRRINHLHSISSFVWCPCPS